MPSGREAGPVVADGAMLDSLFGQAGRGARAESARSDAPGPLLEPLDMIRQAASILAREGSVIPSNPFGMPAAPSMARSSGGPLGGPGTGLDVDRLRRYAHDLIETLLGSLGPAWGGKSQNGEPAVDRVPLIRCAAPVDAGAEASVTLRIANEEPSASDVSLYCTDFVADGGYEIPSLRVAFSPRVATIAVQGEGTFDVTIAVPPQAPPGIYSGLVQASGCKYVKAVVSVEVK